jgi:hypothetical protein
VTFERRVLFLAATPVLAAGLVAASTVAVSAWHISEADPHCTGFVTFIASGAPASSRVTLDFYVGPEFEGQPLLFSAVVSSDAKGAIHQDVKLSDQALHLTPGTDLTVTFAQDHTVQDTFDVPGACPSVSQASGPRTNTSPPTGGGGGSSAPGLPATGFAPDNR